MVFFIKQKTAYEMRISDGSSDVCASDQRMAALLDHDRYETPRKAGSRYFYTHNTGLQNQSPLYVREGLSGEPRLLLDPNGLSADGATALAEWEIGRASCWASVCQYV